MIPARSSRPAAAGPRRQPLRHAARAMVRGRAVCNARGFTLTEILIAIALILIVGALSVYNFENLSKVDQLSPGHALKAELRQARFLAMERRSPVVLTYNKETHTFDLLDPQGNLLENIPDGVNDPQAEVALTFTPILPLKDLMTDPNQNDGDVEYSKKPPLPYLIFDPNGVTAPVKATLTINGEEVSLADAEEQDNNEPPGVLPSKDGRIDPFSEGPPPKAPEEVPPLDDNNSDNSNS